MDKRNVSSGSHSTGLLGRKPIIGLIMFVLGILIFAVIAYNLVNNGPLIKWDFPLAQFFHNLALNTSPWIIDIMIAGYYIGLQGMIIFGVLLGLYFIFKRLWKELVMVCVTMGISGLIFLVLSHIFNRSRPFTLFSTLIWPGSPNVPGFPSGHALSIIVCCGLLLYLFAPKIKSRFGKVLAVIMAILVVIFIGFSRLYIGDHYLTDLIAGYALGIAWFGLTVTLIELLFQRYYSKKGRKRLENERQAKSYK
jgi:undecaprenyl-diphosphatase